MPNKSHLASGNILAAAQHAFQKTVLYTQLFGKVPEACETVPYISHFNYHQASGVLDCIDQDVDIIGALPPFHRNFGRFPFTVVEGGNDLILRQERIVRALIDIGIQKNSRKSILIIADDSTGPFASDLSTGLGWEQHQSSICYLNGYKKDLQDQIKAHEPDFIFWCLIQPPDDWIKMEPERIILALHIDYPIPKPKFAAWLFADEINILGSRPADRVAFDIDQEQFFIENHPVSGLPHLTTLGTVVYPFIRYGFDQSIPVFGNIR